MSVRRATTPERRSPIAQGPVPEGRTTARTRLIWMPAPLLLAAIIAARVAGANEPHTADTLRLVLSFVFYTLVSLSTLFLIGRAFLASGRPGLLLLECGVILWSLSGTLGDAVFHGDANINVTIFNTGILLAGICHLAGAVSSLRPQRPLLRPGLWLAAGSLLTLGVLWLVTEATLAHRLPVFFIPGAGGTAVRHGVLLSAIVLFVLSAALLFADERARRLPFTSWYAPALVLLAVGLFGVMIQLSLGSAVNWLGRTAQWLGGVYLLLAGVAALRDSDVSLLPPAAEARPSFLQRYAMAVAGVLAAAAIRLAFLPSLGTHAAFVTFFPAVMLISLYGGWQPGVLATVLSVILADYFWFEPPRELFSGSSQDWLAAVIFFLSGTMTAVLAEAMLRAQDRARKAEADAQVAAARQHDLDARMAERRRAEEERERLVSELRQADRRKDEFLGTLSHELRNPLTPIRNCLYILRHAAPGGEQAQWASSVIDRQVGHLARLVDDLLDVTRITSGKIRLQRVRLDLVELVRRTVEDHRTLLVDREVVLELPEPPVWVDGDATRLAQVLGNLLHNAAKFTPKDGKVTVSLAAREGNAVVEVADTGLGIDEDTLQRLFQPFAQADRSLDRSKGGLGLGLALVKGMIELHGGRARAHSDGPGRGARFTLEIPLYEGPAAPGASGQSEPPPDRRKRILVIEDNPDAADTLSHVLELSGHTVDVAYEGQSGLAKAHQIRPQVILCDIGLPGDMDGYAVARALRGEPATASVYLVALTGYAQPEDRRRAREEGFDALMAKPPDIPELARLLAQLPS